MIIVETNTHFEISRPKQRIANDLIKWHIDASIRKFDPARGVYLVPKEARKIVNDFAAKHKFTIIQQQSAQTFDEVPPLPSLSEFFLPNGSPMDVTKYLKRTLFPFQDNGVAYWLKNEGVICGDDMGLGKTTQAIAATVLRQVLYGDAFPALIICPSSLKYNWKEEIKTVTGFDSCILNDSIRRSWPNYWKVMNVPFYIVNYESLKSFFVTRMPAGTEEDPFLVKNIKFTPHISIFKTLLVDEAHRMKDTATQQSKFTIGISLFCKYVGILTGTPIVNSPKDAIAYLSAIRKLNSVFKGVKAFTARYCPGGKGGINLKELNYKLRTNGLYMRFKKDVLKDLPDKTRQKVYVDITNMKEYQRALTDLRSWLLEVGKSSVEVQKSMEGEAMVQIGVLKKISAEGKMKAAIEWIKDMLETGEKIITFAEHKDVLKQLKSSIPGTVTIVGDDSTDVRQKNKDRFQNDPTCKHIALSFKAGGEGHTLTASSNVCFIEQGWNPKTRNQAEDRAHRIGQKNYVMCTTFIGRGTIDEDIFNLIEEKDKMVKTVTGDGNTVEMNIVHDLIKILKKNE